MRLYLMLIPYAGLALLAGLAPTPQRALSPDTGQGLAAAATAP